MKNYDSNVKTNKFTTRTRDKLLCYCHCSGSFINLHECFV